MRKNTFFFCIMFLVLLSTVGIFSLLFYTSQKYPSLEYSRFDSLAVTPPMGWNGWNYFRCSPDLNEKSFKEMVDALVSSGMKDAGYRYVNLDDCWQEDLRNAEGKIQVDLTRFPNGIKPLADYVHEKGLLFGIYTSAGRTTCEGKAGSYSYEFQDAKQYADWGVDYIKVDWCGVQYLDPYTQCSVWKEAIEASGRPMVLSTAIAALDAIEGSDAWSWGHGIGESWRTARDLQPYWLGILRVLDLNSLRSEYSSVGSWNDADMLQVGNGDLTIEESKAHFSLWAMMASPLFVGTDIRNMSDNIRFILTRKEIIALNQDPLGYQAKLIMEKDGVQVWEKILQKRGHRAIAILNRGETDQEIEVLWEDLGLFPFVFYKNLWEDQNFQFSSHSFVQKVPAHTATVLKVIGVDSQKVDLRRLP